LTTNGGVLYTNGSGTVTQTAAGTPGTVLHGGTLPTYGLLALGSEVSGMLPLLSGGTGATTPSSALANLGGEPAFASGTTAQYLRGDKTFQTLTTAVVPEGTNLYYTQGRFDTAFSAKTTTNLAEGSNLYYSDARARNALSVSGPLTYNSGTGAFSLGTVGVANGGTGTTSLTQYGLVYGNGSAALSALTPGASGSVLQSNGIGAIPSWVAASGLTAGNVAYSGVTGGTNTTAAMLVGSGASLNFTGTGTINATSLLGGSWAAPGAIGATTPNTGAFTTLALAGNLTFPADNTYDIGALGANRARNLYLGGNATIGGALLMGNGVYTPSAYGSTGPFSLFSAGSLGQSQYYASSDGLRPSIMSLVDVNPTYASTVGLAMNFRLDAVPLGSIVVTSGGSGYPASITNGTVTFTGGDAITAATATYTTNSSGVITGVTLTSPGLYRSAPQTIAFGGGGSGATAYAAMVGIAKTPLDIRHYDIPDTGGDNSSALIVSTGGNGALTSYQVQNLRPLGTRRWAMTLQGAIETGTDTGSQAILAMPGMGFPSQERTTITAPIAGGSTAPATITLTSSAGWPVPGAYEYTAPGGGQVFYPSTLSAQVTDPVTGNVEDFGYTAISGNVLTIASRGLGSTNAAFTTANGSYAEPVFASQGMFTRIMNGVSNGNLVQPGNLVYDSVRLAYAVGNKVGNGAPSGLTWGVRLNGDEFGRSMNVLGAGQVKTAGLSATGGMGGSVIADDTGGLVGNGGAFLVGSGGNIGAPKHFAGMYGYLLDGSSNTTGDLVFATRNLPTDDAIGEKMRITGNGIQQIKASAHLVFGTDNTFDIGANGANRARDLWLGRNALVAGSVGIGTTTPLAALDVAGSASLSGNLSYRGSGTAHTITVLDNGTYTIQRSPGGDMGSVSSLFIGADGNVGIGTTTPSLALDVNGGASLSGNLKFAGGSRTISATAMNNLTIGNASTGNVIINPAGNVGIGTTTPTLGPLQMASGAYVTSGGVWTNASDRNLKTNFTPLDPQAILAKIDTLPVPQWNYKSEDASVRHIGPIAQDFYAAFSLGNNDTSISTIDPAGIALLGIQALDQKYTQLAQGATVGPAQPASPAVSEQSVVTLQTSLQSLADRVTALEKQVPLQSAPISASLSAALTGVGLSTGNDATISGSLIVQGRTTLNDLGVTGTINAGLLSIHGLDGTIDAIGNTLKLQSLGTGSIDLLAGKVTVDASGNIVAKGEITAKKFTIDESDPASASSGNGILKSGSTAVTIKTTAVHAKSHLFVTPRVKTNRVLGVSSESDGISFTVEVVDAPATDIPFDWWIVN